MFQNQKISKCVNTCMAKWITTFLLHPLMGEFWIFKSSLFNEKLRVVRGLLCGETKRGIFRCKILSQGNTCHKCKGPLKGYTGDCSQNYFWIENCKNSLELFLETKSQKYFYVLNFQHEREICSIFLRNVPWFLIVRVQRCIAVDSLGRRRDQDGRRSKLHFWAIYFWWLHGIAEILHRFLNPFTDLSAPASCTLLLPLNENVLKRNSNS